MALRQLTQGIQRLSLQSPTHLTSAVLPSFTSGSVTAALHSITARWLHTSSVCLRFRCQRDRSIILPSKLPSSKNQRWVPLKKMSEMYEYTTRPLPFPKTGGRGPNGRIWNFRRAGGHKRNFRMIDWVRGGTEDGAPLVEKVEKVLYDPNRSARIALVAGGDRKRYIIATQNMQPGDLIKSSKQITKTAVRAQEGDAHPLGSFPIGSLVNCVELIPGEGAMRARAAGVQAQLIRKLESQCIIRLPSKQEICVSSSCVATLGRVSNIDHNKRVIGKAGRNRWFGIRPKSGLWHRKGGRFGRKIKPPKKIKVYEKKLVYERKAPAPYRISVPGKM